MKVAQRNVYESIKKILKNIRIVPQKYWDSTEKVPVKYLEICTALHRLASGGLEYNQTRLMPV